MIKFRKADKSLQMIFGLFMLLIISLVVLNLFFKFTEKSSTKMEGASTEYFSKAEITQARQDCQALCDNIKDTGTMLQFCRTYHRIDWNGNQIEDEKISEGMWDFCESKIPCFVLVDDCGTTSTAGPIYNGKKCQETLSDVSYNRKAWFDELAKDGITDSCGLDEDLTSNWKCKFGFYDSANPGGTPGANCEAGVP